MIAVTLSISGDVAIPVLGAVLVAVFIGLLTAFTTNRRLDRRLAHDREITDQRLAHDRSIKGLELAHDRELRDRDELRVLLDDAARLILDVVTVGANAISLSKDPTKVSEVEQLKKEYAEKARQAVQMEQRIALRLGADDDVTKAYEALARIAVDWTQHFYRWPLPLGEEEQQAALERARAINAPNDRFLKQAHRRVGSKLPETRGSDLSREIRSYPGKR